MAMWNILLPVFPNVRITMLSFLKETFQWCLQHRITLLNLRPTLLCIYAAWHGVFTVGSRQHSFSRVTQSKGSHCLMVFSSKEKEQVVIYERHWKFPLVVTGIFLVSWFACLFVLFLLSIVEKKSCIKIKRVPPLTRKIEW